MLHPAQIHMFINLPWIHDFSSFAIFFPGPMPKTGTASTRNRCFFFARRKPPGASEEHRRAAKDSKESELHWKIPAVGLIWCSFFGCFFYILRVPGPARPARPARWARRWRKHFPMATEWWNDGMMEPQGVAPKVPEVAKPSFRLWNCFHLSRPMMIGGFYTIWSIWQRITYIYQQLVDSIRMP